MSFFQWLCWWTCEAVQKQTNIPEGQDRSWSCDTPLHQEELQHSEAEPFFFSLNGVLVGKPSHSPSSIWTDPLFELPCRHLGHMPPLLKQRRTQNVCIWQTQPSGHFSHKELIWYQAITSSYTLLTASKCYCSSKIRNILKVLKGVDLYSNKKHQAWGIECIYFCLSQM